MKGILYKDYLIPSIIDGSKTQTRRVVRLPKNSCPSWTDADIYIGENGLPSHMDDGMEIDIQPRYKQGETLYIKENHLRRNYINQIKIKHYDSLHLTVSKFNSGKIAKFVTFEKYRLEQFREMGYEKKSKLHLPEWAARHFILITKVWVERLQDISDEDCIKEGIEKISDYDGLCEHSKSSYYFSPHDRKTRYSTPQQAFVALVNHANGGQDIWSENPYVFVYEFTYQKRKANE